MFPLMVILSGPVPGVARKANPVMLIGPNPGNWSGSITVWSRRENDPASDPEESFPAKAALRLGTTILCPKAGAAIATARAIRSKERCTSASLSACPPGDGRFVNPDMPLRISSANSAYSWIETSPFQQRANFQADISRGISGTNAAPGDMCPGQRVSRRRGAGDEEEAKADDGPETRPSIARPRIDDRAIPPSQRDRE